jgi:hypothetical protein
MGSTTSEADRRRSRRHRVGGGSRSLVGMLSVVAAAGLLACALFAIPASATLSISPAATGLTAAPEVVLALPRAGVGANVVSATLTSNGRGVAGASISFSAGPFHLCTAVTNNSGVATCRLSPGLGLIVALSGRYSASFAGNSQYGPSGASTSVVVLKAPQTIQFTSTNPTPVSAGGPSYTPTATATSGLGVTITLDSGSSGCTLSSGIVSFPAAGTCVIDANQAGNGTWAPAVQIQQTITVNKAPQTIQFTSTNPTPANPNTPSYTPMASATSGLPVTIALDSNSSGCTLSGGVVTFVSDGSCVIDASQLGNGAWAAASQAQQTIVVDAEQTISFSSMSPSAVNAGDASYTPMASATSGLAVTIKLDSSSSGCTLSGGIVSFPADATNGSCVIDASQGGGDGWDPATQAQQTIAVFPVAELVFDAAAVDVGQGQYDWGTSLTAQGLSPNSTIFICEGSSPCGPGSSANASGAMYVPGPLLACGEQSFPLYWQATAADGKTIDSATVDSSPCPGP